MFVFTGFAMKHKTELRCFLFPLIFQSPPVVNSVDWSVYIRAHGWQCTSEHKQSVTSKGLSIGIWDRMRHKSGKGYRNFSAALKDPMSTVLCVEFWEKMSSNIPTYGQSEALWVLSRFTVLPHTPLSCEFVPLPLVVLSTFISSPCLILKMSVLPLLLIINHSSASALGF